MPIVDNAIYREGVRQTRAVTLDQTFEALRDGGGFAWIGMYRPTEDELRAVATEFGLHELAVEDALVGHQRPKLERYGETLFLVLRPARYLDAPEEVEFGEVHLFIGPNFAITVRHAESPDLGRVRKRLEQNPALLALGPQAILYAVLDQVVDEYQPVIAGLENDIDEIEDQLFQGDPAVSRRIYELATEAMGFQRATHPLVEMLGQLESGYEKYHVDMELQRDFRDVLDHTLQIVARADSFRAILQNALTVQSTLVTQAQNDEIRNMTQASIDQGDQVKKISGWAAILFAPTLIGAIYGMNFRFMPELDWPLGYPFALGLMAVSGVVLYVVFKRRGWL
ncbi:MAG TPA: magnesium and cobalt transport protein CorA [Rhodoglobus sp.]|nr:magnesium and cobalt transport protein CorA [Rhodoglobus sp.]HOY81532.1 magnesium and cobalt transport protein CorA [Rhodoglobus sp.]HQG69466.1 magnesium and cobalt transport protein CorA [Rhodoglobus sp.]HQI66098.1 magnesium and cobalt transport protein CorA [Rhodoglobus sp.]HQJ33735.1 magnesium and cobalt transport protein CorA [Rhodoglobus sp.]